MPAPRRIVAAVLVLTLCSCLPGLAQIPVRYDDWKLVRAYPQAADELAQIHDAGALLMSESEGYGPVDYLVPPEGLAALTAAGVAFELLHENIQMEIDAERARLARPLRTDPRDPAWFNDYRPFDDIVGKMQAMVADAPDRVSLIDIGNSHEGRDLWALRISGPGEGKPAVLFNATQHAREWIGPMTVMWLAEQLVYQYDADPEIRDLVDRVEFFIVPVVNPDGYVYSWTVDRMWRKNRRVSLGSGCVGVDLNRNWDAGWSGVGASGDPCSQTYYGPGPLSEPETRALADFVLANPQIVATIDYHSYSQLILSPYGYTSALPPDHATFMALNEAMHDEIHAVWGKQYDYGPIYTTIYPASGGNADWCYDTAGAFGFSIELRDTGTYGFLLPPQQIIPTGQENGPAAMYLAAWVGTPLKISFPADLPQFLVPDTETPLVVKIEPLSGDLQADSVRLHTRIGLAGDFVESTPLPLGAEQFQATLPATPCGATLFYYVSAASTSGQVVLMPAHGPVEPLSVPAAPVVVPFEDDMETDRGWTAGAPDDTATSGLWTRMDPEPTAAQPGDDHSPAPGTICWVTDGRAGTSSGSYDVDGGTTTLISPAFDGTGDSVLISYWRWFSNDRGGNPYTDVFRVDISNDDGATWTNVEVVGPAGPEVSGGWFYHEFRLADLGVAGSDRMRVRFVASDEGDGAVVEAAVDDFRVLASAECPLDKRGDCDCDGDVDFFDIDYFLKALAGEAAWHSFYAERHDGAAPACTFANCDCNADGVVDFFDIDAFLDQLGT